MIVWGVQSRFPQLPLRRLFVRLERPVPPNAEIVTAYTDGRVTLRRNVRLEGYHEAADLSGFRGVAIGDFVVHGLDILRGSVGVSDSEGAISAVCSVARPRPDIDPRYCAYVIRAQAASGFIRALARGIREGGADFRRWETLGDLPLLVPPASVQATIADYLDRETSRMDALIAAKRRMIELLTEAEEAEVLDLVGDWRRVQTGSLRQLGTQVVTGPFGTQLAASEYVVGGIPLVNPTHIARGRIFADLEVTVPPDVAARLARHRLDVEDVVLGRKGDVGRSAIVSQNEQGWICGSDSIAVRTNKSRLLPQFLVAVLGLSLYRQQLEAASSGATLANVNEGTLLSLRVPSLSVQAQQGTIEAAKHIRERFDSLSGAINGQLELLRERKQVVITAAITGKLSIPGEAA